MSFVGVGAVRESSDLGCIPNCSEVFDPPTPSNHSEPCPPLHSPGAPSQTPPPTTPIVALGLD